MRTCLNLLILSTLVYTFGRPASAQPIEVIAATKITEGAGGFTGDLHIQDEFGSSVAGLGDLDGDGVEDLAVGAWWDEDGGGFDEGSVWILFLNADGTVGSHQKISATEGGFTGPLLGFDNFGESVSAIGDLDGDGVTDLAVGAPGAGAIWVLFLNPDGTVRAEQKIAEGVGGFTGDLGNAADLFGEGVTPLGDLNGDGVTELAVGAPLDDDGGGGQFTNRGAVWILSLNADGTVRANRKISQTEGGFDGVLLEMDNFGKDVAAVGDVDGDGVIDLAVGAWADQDGGPLSGAVWIVFLNANGTVRAEQKISATQGGFTGDIGVSDFFGAGVGALGDLDADGVPDVAVGAFNYDEGAVFNSGAVWVLYLNPDGTVKAYSEISNATPGFEGRLDVDDQFGIDVALLGDLDGDSSPEIAVGAWFDSDAGFGAGAAWTLSLDIADEPPALAVDVAATEPPIEISAAGGEFTFTFSITNTTGASQTFQAWTEATYPDGSTRLALGPVTVTLAPGQSATRTLVQQVPASLPTGAYTYTGYVGAFPDDVIASDSFRGVKTLFGREAAGHGEWATLYAESGAPVTADDVWTADDPAAEAQTSAAGALAGAFARVVVGPNPVSDRAAVALTLAAPSEVRLALYDVLGREVASVDAGTLASGSHQLGLNVGSLPSGVYVWRLTAGTHAETGRLTVAH